MTRYLAQNRTQSGRVSPRSLPNMAFSLRVTGNDTRYEWWANKRKNKNRMVGSHQTSSCLALFLGVGGLDINRLQEKSPAWPTSHSIGKGYSRVPGEEKEDNGDTMVRWRCVHSGTSSCRRADGATMSLYALMSSIYGGTTAELSGRKTKSSAWRSAEDR